LAVARDGRVVRLVILRGRKEKISVLSELKRGWVVASTGYSRFTPSLHGGGHFVTVPANSALWANVLVPTETSAANANMRKRIAVSIKSARSSNHIFK